MVWKGKQLNGEIGEEDEEKDESIFIFLFLEYRVNFAYTKKHRREDAKGSELLSVKIQSIFRRHVLFW